MERLLNTFYLEDRNCPRKNIYYSRKLRFISRRSDNLFCSSLKFTTCRQLSEQRDVAPGESNLDYLAKQTRELTDFRYHGFVYDIFSEIIHLEDLHFYHTLFLRTYLSGPTTVIDC